MESKKKKKKVNIQIELSASAAAVISFLMYYKLEKKITLLQNGLTKKTFGNKNNKLESPASDGEYYRAIEGEDKLLVAVNLELKLPLKFFI